MWVFFNAALVYSMYVRTLSSVALKRRWEFAEDAIGEA